MTTVNKPSYLNVLRKNRFSNINEVEYSNFIKLLAELMRNNDVEILQKNYSYICEALSRIFNYPFFIKITFIENLKTVNLVLCCRIDEKTYIASEVGNLFEKECSENFLGAELLFAADRLIDRMEIYLSYLEKEYGRPTKTSKTVEDLKVKIWRRLYKNRTRNTKQKNN